MAVILFPSLLASEFLTFLLNEAILLFVNLVFASVLIEASLFPVPKFLATPRSPAGKSKLAFAASSSDGLYGTPALEMIASKRLPITLSILVWRSILAVSLVPPLDILVLTDNSLDPS